VKLDTEDGPKRKGSGMQLDWQEITKKIQDLGVQRSILLKEWREIQSMCAHRSLPRRELGEQYMDTCPDCGYVVYSYGL
jgi:hypothetical protein